MKPLLFALSLAYLSVGASPEAPTSEKITLPQYYSHSVDCGPLERLAVGNSQIAKVREIPGKGFLVTGVRPGRTLVRAWKRSGPEQAYEVTVTAAEAFIPAEAEESVVKISLEFLELDSQFGRAVGVRWPDVLQWSAGGGWNGEATGSGLNYVFSFSSAKGFLEHLQKEGWAKLLARPELSVRLGEEAMFHSGGEIPVATSSESYGRSHRHVEWKAYGLTLRVRPQSADHLQIHSSIRLEMSELDRAASGEGVPGLTKRSLDTKMSSRDGETVLLSGLVRQINAVGKQSVPFLGNLPVVGPLFARTDEQKEDREMLVAVTFAFRNQGRDQAQRQQFIERLETEER